MTALVDRALALNPNYAGGWQISGILRLWAGQPDIAIEHAEVSLRLSPRARVGTPFALIWAPHISSAGALMRQLPQLLASDSRGSELPDAYRSLAACYAHMGRLDEAREIVSRLRAHYLSSSYRTPSFAPDPEHRELLLSGLRLATADAN